MVSSSLWRRIEQRLDRRKEKARLRSSVQLVHGPAMTRLKDEEVSLVLVGRNVAYFLDYHIRHHLALGVSHVVYMDNGSTDDSIAVAKRFPNVTIACCSADFRTHQGWIRFIANTEFLSGGWRLAIDPDELLDYPNSDRIKLTELTRRLAARGHSAMVAQMLEMVPQGPLAAMGGVDFPQAVHCFDRFSVDDITSYPYHGEMFTWFLDQNRITNPDIQLLFGGLRHAAFGEDCCLTKHALFRMKRGVIPHPHPHITTGVTCTDFSAVLKHYKFAGNMLDREAKLISENRLSHEEAKLRVDRMKEDEDIDLSCYAAGRGPSVARLLDLGFLKMSDAAREMLT